MGIPVWIVAFIVGLVFMMHGNKLGVVAIVISGLLFALNCILPGND